MRDQWGCLLWVLGGPCRAADRRRTPRTRRESEGCGSVRAGSLLGRRGLAAMVLLPPLLARCLEVLRVGIHLCPAGAECDHATGDADGNNGSAQ